MASPMITIKVAVISTGIAAMSLFVKSCVPIVVDFSLSRFPILWSSFLSWLKPTYIFAIINVIIITTIVASSKYFQSTSDQDYEVRDVDMVVVTDVDRSEVVCEEKEEEEITGLNNGGDEFVALTWKLNKVPTITDETKTKKPLVSARFSHRKPVKVTLKGNKRKAPRVVRPKWHANTRKMMVTKEDELQPVLRELETFRDMTNNYPMSPTVKLPVKMSREMSPSLEELNRKCEAFIKKSKEKMLLESLKLDKDVDLQKSLISF